MDSIFSEGLLGSEIKVHLKFVSASLRSSIWSLSELFGVSVEVSFDDHLLSSRHFGVFDRGVFIISCCFPRVEARISWLLSQSEILLALRSSWVIIVDLFLRASRSPLIAVSSLSLFWSGVGVFSRLVIWILRSNILLSINCQMSVFILLSSRKLLKMFFAMGISCMRNCLGSCRFLMIWSYWEIWSERSGFFLICLNLIFWITLLKLALISWEISWL